MAEFYVPNPQRNSNVLAKVDSGLNLDRKKITQKLQTARLSINAKKTIHELEELMVLDSDSDEDKDRKKKVPGKIKHLLPWRQV